MKYIRRCPLVVMMALSILIYEVFTGVPKVLAFAEAQISKKEYRVKIYISMRYNFKMLLPLYSPKRKNNRFIVLP